MLPILSKGGSNLSSSGFSFFFSLSWIKSWTPCKHLCLQVFVDLFWVLFLLIWRCENSVSVTIQPSQGKCARKCQRDDKCQYLTRSWNDAPNASVFLTDLRAYHTFQVYLKTWKLWTASGPWPTIITISPVSFIKPLLHAAHRHKDTNIQLSRNKAETLQSASIVSSWWNVCADITPEDVKELESKHRSSSFSQKSTKPKCCILPAESEISWLYWPRDISQSEDPSGRSQEWISMIKT